MLLLLCAVVIGNVYVFARAQSVEDTKITIGCANQTLDQALQLLKNAAGVQVFYMANDVQPYKSVTLEKKTRTVKETLELLLSNTTLSYKVDGNKIMFTNNRKAALIEASLPMADTVTLRGRVTSEDGKPLEGVAVQVKNSVKGTTTNSNGDFEIRAGGFPATLLFSFIGYEKAELIVKENVRSNIKMRIDDINTLDEAVVVAYGTTTQRKNVGAISVVKGDNIKNLPNRSFDRSLQGQVPGLLITSGNNVPGGGTANFIIRGIGTGGLSGRGTSNRQPLIVVDGTPINTNSFQTTGITSVATPVTNPLAQLSPSDIESYSVLKDASAIALYGSKASNGVILITTKQGNAGKTTITFHHQTDIASRVRNQKVEILNQPEYLQLLRETYKNTNSTLWTDDAITRDLRGRFPTFINEIGDTTFYNEKKWSSALFNDIAPTIDNELSFSGGTVGKTRYYLGVGYVTQDGIIKNTGYDRASVRYNFLNNVSKVFNYGVNAALSYNVQQYGSAGNDASDPFGSPYIASPISPIKLIDGSYNLLPTSFNYSSFFVSNPVAALEYNIGKAVSYRGLFNGFAELKLSDNISIKTNLGSDFMLGETKDKIDPRLPISLTSPVGIGQIIASNSRKTRLITTNSVSFNKVFDKHLINILIAQEAQIMTGNFDMIVRQGIPLALPYLSQPNNAATLISASSNEDQKETLLSYFAQANYSFSKKYYTSLSLRRDGSSKFGSSNRYGNYWSIGLGWELTEEEFLRGMKASVDLLKLRGSLGESGNSASLSSTTRFSLLTTGGSYNGSPSSTLTSTPGNPDIKWENNFSYDIGLDYSIFKHKISGSIDIYLRNISNLLYTTNLPLVSGYSSVTDNIGKMENKGIEVSLNSNIIRDKKFSWEINLNWSTNKNKLTKASANLFINGNLIDSIGTSFDSYYLVRWAGVNSDNGKPQWYDREGKITNTYSASNKAIVGKPQPDGFGGITNTFNYSGFRLSFLIYYQYGFKIYDQARAVMENDGTYPFLNQFKSALDYWRKPGDNSKNPRRILNNTDGGALFPSTRFLYDGDFVRLKNVTLSYSLPSDIVKRLNLNSVKFYIQGNNLLLLTKFPGFDPENTSETGMNYFAYPQSRSFSFGFDINF